MGGEEKERTEGRAAAASASPAGRPTRRLEATTTAGGEDGVAIGVAATAAPTKAQHPGVSGRTTVSSQQEWDARGSASPQGHAATRGASALTSRSATATDDANRLT